MMYFFLLFFFFLESKGALTKAESTNDDSSKKSVCNTESGASPNLPCIFPFRYNGGIHTSCIWDDAQYTHHKPWCSTKVDKAGHHIKRQSKWGNCGPECPISPDSRNETTTVTGRTWFLSSLAPYSYRPSGASRKCFLVKGILLYKIRGRYRYRAGIPAFCDFKNSWSPLFRDSVSGIKFVNSSPFQDFG